MVCTADHSRILRMKGPHNLSIKIMAARIHSTHSWCCLGICASSAQILKVMRVVNWTCRNLARFPAKSCIAYRAIHLIASRDFCDHCAAFRTRFCIRCKKPRCCHFCRIASVRRVVTSRTFYLMTFGAAKQITKAAFPGRAQEPFAVGRRTCANETNHRLPIERKAEA